MNRAEIVRETRLLLEIIIILTIILVRETVSGVQATAYLQIVLGEGVLK